jgi:hypothetical protein
MVLPPQRRRAASGVHRQGPDGEARFLGIRGVAPPERQAKLVVYTDMLHRLVGKGLTAAAVVANFCRQRVLSLMERRLPIYKLTSEAPSEGSRMMAELLSHEIAAQRAGCTAAPPSDRPWRSLGNQDAPRGGVRSTGKIRF